jgi:hypothetical protein
MWNYAAEERTDNGVVLCAIRGMKTVDKDPGLKTPRRRRGASELYIVNPRELLLFRLALAFDWRGKVKGSWRKEVSAMVCRNVASFAVSSHVSASTSRVAHHRPHLTLVEEK